MLSLLQKIVIGALFFSYLISAFSPYHYLVKKGYRYQVFNWGKERYDRDFQIVLKPFSRIFQVKSFSYFFQHEPIIGAEGILLSRRDEAFFKKVVEFYESKHRNLSSGKKPLTNKKPIVKPKKKASLKPENSISFDDSEAKQKIDYIFIDPGHGGRDPGAIFYGYQEKKITLSLSLELKDILASRLAGKKTKIVMTRNKDRYVSLEDRCQLANHLLKQNENGLFLSIHLNIWINPNSRGFEIYYLSHDEEINQERVYTHLEDVGVSQADYFKKIFSYLEVVQYQRESYFLSNLVTDLMVKRIKNYPIRENFKSDIFYVLRGVLMPSVLLELGFISNREDMEFLNDPQKKQRMLETVADSILVYVQEFEKSNGFKDGLFLEKTALMQ